MTNITGNNRTNNSVKNSNLPPNDNTVGTMAADMSIGTNMQRTSEGDDEEAGGMESQNGAHENDNSSPTSVNTPTIHNERHNNLCAGATGQISKEKAHQQQDIVSFGTSAGMNEEATPDHGIVRQATMTSIDDEKKRGIGNQEQRAFYNNRCWDKKRQRLTSNNIPLPAKKTAIRFSSEAQAKFGLVNQSIKWYKHTFELKKTNRGEPTEPFSRETNRQAIYVGMGILHACLLNTHIYNPIHAGDFKDDLNSDQQKDNRQQLRNYFLEELKVEVSNDNHETKSLVSRLCRTMSRIKQAPREEHELQYNKLLRHFMPISEAREHMSTYKNNPCPDPKCALCKTVTTTANSFHTENVKWKDGCIYFYEPQPHLEMPVLVAQNGVLPPPTDMSGTLAATSNSTLAATSNSNGRDTHSTPVRTYPLTFHVETLQDEDKCWYVGDDISSAANGATIFGPLSNYSGCTLTPEECNFVETQLPKAFACRGSVDFFAHLVEARKKGKEGFFQKSTRLIQANCVELYVDVDTGQNRDTACIEHFFRTFCNSYKGNPLETLKKYTKAQLNRDPRTQSDIRSISGHALIVCLAGAPAQNVHGDHNIKDEFQGSLTLTTNTLPTQLYYGMEPVDTFQKILMLWSSLDICKKFNLSVPDTKRAKELEDEFDTDCLSIISDYGSAFIPMPVLKRYAVHNPHGPDGFVNQPGTQLVMSSCFLHAGPGLPSSDDIETEPPFSPTTVDINQALSTTYAAPAADMNNAPPNNIRVGMFFSTHRHNSAKYDDDKQYYGFNAMIQLAVRLWDASTSDEKELCRWLVADYAFTSTCDVMPFIYDFKGHDLHLVANCVEKRRNAWFSSNNHPENGRGYWYDDIHNLLTVWKGGCTIDMAHFNSLLKPKLRSMGIVSLLDNEGQQAAKNTGCMWLDNSAKSHMLRMFDSMVQTSNKTKSGMANISDTNMSYSKYACSTDMGIAVVVNNNVFGKNRQDKDTYCNLGSRLEEKIIDKIRTKIGTQPQQQSIVCTLMRSDSETKLQQWHYDYYPMKEQSEGAIPSFSSVTPLTLGGSYLQLYNQETDTPFILHIPRGFTLIFDDMTIHSGGYLFDEGTSDKRLHHYIIFKGGPPLRDDHAIYLYRKNTNREKSQPEDLLSTSLRNQFDDDGTTQERVLQQAGWFVFHE